MRVKAEVGNAEKRWKKMEEGEEEGKR